MQKFKGYLLPIVFLIGVLFGASIQRHYDTEGKRRSAKIISQVLTSAVKKNKPAIQEKMINENVSSEHVNADACIVWCFDPRFKELLSDFEKKLNYRHIDEVKVAGGAKDILSDDGYAMDQIRKSCALHHTKEIILMLHINCGAYNGESNPEIYTKELDLIREVVQEVLKTYNYTPKIRTVLAKFDGLYEIR